MIANKVSLHQPPHINRTHWEIHMFIKTTLAVTATVLGLTFAAPAAFADDAGEIKYRQSVMKSVGGHMGAIAAILGGATTNAADLQLHTDGMAALAGLAGNVFPKGSDFGETSALPVIWEKSDDFAKAVKMFQDSAATMAAAAKSGDMAQAGAAFAELGKSCKNCHETFREKKQ
jgi:cytochrome c556